MSLHAIKPCVLLVLLVISSDIYYDICEQVRTACVTDCRQFIYVLYVSIRLVCVYWLDYFRPTQFRFAFGVCCTFVTNSPL